MLFCHGRPCSTIPDEAAPKACTEEKTLPPLLEGKCHGPVEQTHGATKLGFFHVLHDRRQYSLKQKSSVPGPQNQEKEVAEAGYLDAFDRLFS